MLTLWDLIEPVAKRLDPRKAPPRPAERPAPPPPPRSRNTQNRVSPRPAAAAPKATRPAPKPAPKTDGMQARYDAVVQEMLRTYGVRVRKWRTSMSGVAWTVTYADGRVSRLIESPRPKGPMSAAVFLHEIGHHAIGLGVYRPRCLEEYHAWAWSLRQMEASGLNITDAVRHRMHASLYYAIAKAQRRGIKELPPELEPYARRPARRPRARAATS